MLAVFFSEADLLLTTNRSFAAILLVTFSLVPLVARTSLAESRRSKLGGQDQAKGSAGSSSSELQPETKENKKDPAAPGALDNPLELNKSEGKQPKRILWIIPNYRAVSANTQLPPLSVKGKFWLATEDTFDYSSFALAGIIAGKSESGNATPEFHRGLAGYQRYYWHSSADLAVGNYFTEAIVPVLTREDPRYYTLGHGGFFHRTGYAVSRLLIARTDSGGSTFNFSEILGNGAGAGISDLYYPRQERTWSQTWQKWLLQIGLDGIFNMGKEFWPDINHRVFHDHY